MTAEQRPTRKPGLLVAAAALLVTAGTVFGIGTYYEHKRIREIRDLIATVSAPFTLTADDISSSLFGRTLTLTGVRGTMPYGGETVSFSIDTVAGESLNPAAFAAEGVHTPAGRITLTGLRGSGSSWTCTAASGVLEDVRGDFRRIAEERDGIRTALLAIVRERAARVDDADSADSADRAARPHTSLPPASELLLRHKVPMTGLCEALDTVAFGEIAFRDVHLTVAQDAGAFVLAMASFRASSYSLMRSGPMRVTELALGFDGKKSAFLEEWSMEGFSIGEGAGMLEMLSRNAPSEDVGKALRENGFTLDDFLLRGLLVNIPFSGTDVIPVRMREGSFTLRVRPESASLRIGYSGLAVETRDFLRALDPADRALLEPLLPGRLTASSTLNADLLWREDSSIDLNVSPLASSVEGLWATSLSVDVLGIRERHGQKQGFLNAFSFAVTDAGALDILFRIVGGKEGENPEDVRNMVAMIVEAQKNTLRGPVREAAEHFAAFLKTPGATFSLAVRPVPPFDLNDLDKIDTLLASDPDSLGLTSSFTPGQ